MVFLTIVDIIMINLLIGKSNALSIIEKPLISSKIDYFIFWEITWILNKFLNKLSLIGWYEIYRIFWISSFFYKIWNFAYKIEIYFKVIEIC